MTSKNATKNGGLPFSFHRKKTMKGQFWLKMIILREGTFASFKTTPFSPGRIVQIAMKNIRTTQEAII